MTDDPFHHLHDEGYAAATMQPRATASGLVHTGGRAAESLDGEWHFTPDLFDEGLRQRWWADDDRPASEWRIPRDAELWRAETLPVPGCWTMARPEWRHFEGAGWYARRFVWHAGSPRTVLRVAAAAADARVFLNGRFLAFHTGGSTPFCVELTGVVRPGENLLLIQVDNRRRPDRVPMHHFDWFNHGGLHRSVTLLHLPAVFIRRFAVWQAPGGIGVELRLSDPVDGTAELELAGVRATVELSAGVGEAVIQATPEPWSPEFPVLHDMRARFGCDAVSDRVGLRTLGTSGGDITLNGRPIFLRGVCVHEDDRDTGRVSTEADMRRRAAHAKELGCNALRLAHAPHDERMARIADAAGLLLWSEVPVYWAIDFANPATYADALNQLLELIERDRNRASVALWGVGNENADTEPRYRFMRDLAQAARAEDPTRLIAAACLINRETFRIEDRLIQHLDVVGLNEYFGWYEPGFDGLERLLAGSAPGKPLVISETGADAVAGFEGEPGVLFSEAHQAAIYRGQIAAAARHDAVRGFFPWLLYDFRSERRQTGYQRGWNRKGLIAEDKATHKQAFRVLADWYAALSRPPPEAP